MTRSRIAEYVAAGLVMAGAFAFGVHEITARPTAPVHSTAWPTEFSGGPMTYEHCGEIYRQIAGALSDGARDLDNPEPRARHEGLRRLYNTDCPDLCGKGGCQ